MDEITILKVCTGANEAGLLNIGQLLKEDILEREIDLQPFWTYIWEREYIYKQKLFKDIISSKENDRNNPLVLQKMIVTCKLKELSSTQLVLTKEFADLLYFGGKLITRGVLTEMANPQLLSNILPSLTHIHSLNLSLTRIGPQGCKYIRDNIISGDSLQFMQILNLSNSLILDEGFAYIFHGVSATIRKPNMLSELNVTGCDITFKSILQLKEFYDNYAADTRLTKVSMIKNFYTDILQMKKVDQCIKAIIRNMNLIGKIVIIQYL